MTSFKDWVFEKCKPALERKEYELAIDRAIMETLLAVSNYLCENKEEVSFKIITETHNWMMSSYDYDKFIR